MVKDNEDHLLLDNNLKNAEVLNPDSMSVHASDGVIKGAKINFISAVSDANNVMIHSPQATKILSDLPDRMTVTPNGDVIVPKEITPTPQQPVDTPTSAPSTLTR